MVNDGELTAGPDTWKIPSIATWMWPFMILGKVNQQEETDK